MILDAIVLENFGVYAGRQEIVLTPEREGRPIILFGGMNGGGKTTFLDAVQLAFYGSKARCSNRGKLPYRDYLLGAIHRGVSLNDGASIEIHFRRAVDGLIHSYRLRRAWREGARGFEETVDVLFDGNPDPFLTEHWDDYIESYIPSSISHLFFFDAEQIQELAEGERAAELLGTAIHSLLGLDIVDQLGTDLLALERRKRIASKNREEANRLRQFEEEVERLDQMLEQVTAEKARHTSELDQLANAAEKCQHRFRLEGGELFEKRTELEAALDQLQNQLLAEENALREIAAGYAPLLLTLPLLAETESQIRTEAEVGETQILISALERRDSDVLDQMRDSNMSDDHVSQLDAILRRDREMRTQLVKQPVCINADEHLASELHHLLTIVLPELSVEIPRRLEAVKVICERITRLEVNLARVPAAETIAELQRELGALRDRRRQKQAELEGIEAKRQLIERQHKAAAEALNRALNENIEVEFAAEDRARIMKHSSKVRATLSRLSLAIIQKNAGRVESLMLEAFKQLLRKTSLVTDLKIDPKTFRIALTGGNNQPLPFERLSAGERQLLATSLLWGLARASGRPLPTIIDTPLGRLDSSHRRHLVDRYFPVASHQVILLSTDEEIDAESFSRLQRYIGRAYCLQFDEASRSTHIVSGYFWNYEAAC